ncbi:MAG: glycosyltransferase family 2 protein [Magnetococcales bacterium]|nr:glycosyltransferase family 2 protein [Magnetococcales bacterium]
MANQTEHGEIFLQEQIHAISIIIPCKNEEKAIEMTIKNIQQAMDETDIDYEIIVVDDGSSDRTRTLALEANARVLVHQINLGYGNAIMDGIRISRFATIAIMDADGTYPANQLPLLIRNLSSYDMVVGQRTWTPDNTSLLGRFFRRALYYTILLLSGIKCPDFNSGFRVFHKYNILDYRSILCPTFSFTTTLTVLFLQTHHSVFFLPIDYAKRVGRSKVNYFKDAFRTFAFVFAITSVFRPYRINLLLMIIGIIFNMLILLASHQFTIGGGMQVGLHLLASIPLLIASFSVDSFINSRIYHKEISKLSETKL